MNRIALIASTLLLFCAFAATAFDGPYTSSVDVGGGVSLDVDVRWPDTGSPPAAGWPVIVLAHGAGGSKASLSGLGAQFADDGYVTLAYSNRPDATSQLPSVFASDVAALKSWLLNDFEAESAEVVPTDADAFGITGNSLGGYVSWSAVTLTNEFAAAVPYNWGFHAFVDHMVRNESIELTTGGGLTSLVGGVYPAAALDSVLEAVFGPAIGNLASVDFPVMNQLAMLDLRTSGSDALSDHLAVGSGGGSAQKIVYLGTGGHGTPSTDNAFRDGLRVDFFAFHLKGVANGVDAELPIQMSLLATNEKLPLASWPPPGQQLSTVFLHENGALRLEAPGSLSKESPACGESGASTWADAAPGFGLSTIRNNLPKETLAYETEPLLSEALLVGEPSVELHVAGTGSRYQLNVHLLDAEDGQDPILLAYGTATVDTTPAVVDIDLTVTGRRLPAGHRLRLEITNRDDQDVNHLDGYTPETTGRIRYIPFFEHSTTTVFHDLVRPSSLTLPLVGASELPIATTVVAQAITAKRLLIKNRLPDDESKNRVVWLSRDPSLSAPAPGGADDPRCEGDPVGTAKASLTVSSDSSGQLHSIGLPCQNWELIGSAASPKGFRYLDKELDDGTVKKVVWKAGKLLRAVLQGRGPTTLDYDLQVGVSEGTADVIVTSGAMALCGACGPFNGRDGSDGKRFQGKDCSAPVSCP